MWCKVARSNAEELYTRQSILHEERHHTMTKLKEEADPPVPNVISADTGPLDERFIIWRAFCAEHQVAVETLPGDLAEALKTEWESMKVEQLHTPAEDET